MITTITRYAALCALAGAFAQGAAAYNPPAGGEGVPFLGHPGLVAGGSATAGGLFFNPFRQGGSSTAPYAARVNPALTANNQRVSLDAGYTGVFGGGASGAVSLGALVPARRGVFAAGISAAFAGSRGGAPALGNTVLFTGAFSRDITADLYVGAALSAGVNGGDGARTSGALYGALGFAYRLGTLGGLSDCAAGVTLDGLGRGFDGGRPGPDGGDSSPYPATFTPKAGFAALFWRGAAGQAGFSAGVSFPFARDAAFDAGVQARFGGVMAAAGWAFDIREALAGTPANLPYIEISYTFTADTGKLGAQARRDWGRSDVKVSGLWQGMYEGGAQRAGAGAVINLGSLSREPPRIIIEE